MYTKYKTPALVNLDFTTTFTPTLLLKDMDLGLGASKALGVPMPTASATRDSILALAHQYPGDIDFSGAAGRAGARRRHDRGAENVESVTA